MNARSFSKLDGLSVLACVFAAWAGCHGDAARSGKADAGPADAGAADAARAGEDMGGSHAGGVNTGGIPGTGGLALGGAKDGATDGAAVDGAVDTWRSPGSDGPATWLDLANTQSDAALDVALDRATSSGEAGDVGRPGDDAPFVQRDLAPFDTGQASLPYLLGADISSMQEQIDQGAHYADIDGTQKSLLEVLKSHGFNAIRVRTFVSPSAPYGYDYGTGGTCIKSAAYGDKAHIVAMGQLIRAAGMRFLLDFHYSDNWADPGKQIVPQLWRKATTVADLAALLKAYTKDVLSGLGAVGAQPDLVQVGNEITPGLCMHIPNSSTDCFGNNVSPSPVNGSTADWSNTATLLKAGIEGVRETTPAIPVMLHIESTKDLAATRSWVRNAISHGVTFDILGLSCYTAFQGAPSVWQATFQAMAAEFPALSFAIAEYNPDRTLANQMIHDLPSRRGVGAFLWEPTQSGAWGTSLFTYANGVYRAQAAAFAEYDSLRGSLGLAK